MKPSSSCPNTSCLAADLTLAPFNGAFFIMRLTFYSAIFYAFNASLPFLLQATSNRLFRENGIMEWIQFALLIFTGCLFCYSAWKRRQFRQLFQVMAAVTFFAAIRELNNLLAVYIPYVSWKVAFLVYPILLWLLRGHWTALKRQISCFSGTSAFAILWAASILVVPVAQCIGHGDFLYLLTEDHWNRALKRTLEESLELGGYFILACGSVESFLRLKIASGNSQSDNFSSATKEHQPD